MDEKAVKELAKELRKPEAITQQFFLKPFSTPCTSAEHPELPPFLSVPLMAIPEGWKLEDLKPYLDKFRDKPERRKGRVVLQEAQSFINYVNRAKGADTVLFASSSVFQGDIIAVFDYDPAGSDQSEAGWHDMQAHYPFRTSEAFKIWSAQSGKKLGMKDFAKFMNDRIPDLGVATDENPVKFDLGILNPEYAEPSAILELADGITLNAKKKYSQHQRLSSGEHQIEFAEEHGETTTKAGKTVKVPGFFLLNISVFEEGEKVLIPVRLRYSVGDDNGIGWTFDVWNVTEIFRLTFREEVAKITGQTELPQFFGNP